MKTEWVLSQEAFDALLAWLDPDRDRAGEKYEQIRRKLIENFVHRGCLNPEELTDEVINRVTRKVPEIAGTYAGDPALYFDDVAQRVFINYWRKGPDPKPLHRVPNRRGRVESTVPGATLGQLGVESRELILNYYQQERLQ